MALNSRQLDENGYAKCAVCGKKVYISNLESCIRCDRFACKSCTTKINGCSVCKKCNR